MPLTPALQTPPPSVSQQTIEESLERTAGHKAAHTPQEKGNAIERGDGKGVLSTHAGVMSALT